MLPNRYLLPCCFCVPFFLLHLHRKSNVIMEDVSKTGVKEFVFNVDMFADPRLRELRDRDGVKGVMAYIYLLSKLHKTNGYFVERTDALYEDIEHFCQFEKNDDVHHVFCSLIRVKLLDEDMANKHHVFTSREIQTDFLRLIKRRKGYTPILKASKYWMLGTQDNIIAK